MRKVAYRRRIAVVDAKVDLTRQ